MGIAWESDGAGRGTHLARARRAAGRETRAKVAAIAASPAPAGAPCLLVSLVLLFGGLRSQEACVSSVFKWSVLVLASASCYALFILHEAISTEAYHFCWPLNYLTIYGWVEYPA
jgi:hypothetical protein